MSIFLTAYSSVNQDLQIINLQKAHFSLPIRNPLWKFLQVHIHEITSFPVLEDLNRE